MDTSQDRTAYLEHLISMIAPKVSTARKADTEQVLAGALAQDADPTTLAALGAERTRLLAQVAAVTDRLAGASLTALDTGTGKTETCLQAGITRAALDLWLHGWRPADRRAPQTVWTCWTQR